MNIAVNPSSGYTDPRKRGSVMRSYVYVIENLRNSDKYVGVSDNPPKRWRQHIWSAERGRNSHFARALRKYGQHFFDFRVVSRHKDKREALDAEVAYIESYGGEYNMTKGGDGLVGFRWAPGTHPRIGKTHTEETKKILAEHTRRQLKGKPQSKELVEKRAAALRGRPLSEAHKESLRRGHRNSPTRRTAHMKVVVCVNDGKEFLGRNAAAEYYRVSKQVVYEYCSGRTQKIKKWGRPRTLDDKGLVFRYKEDVCPS